ncbi:MAG TPA: alanine--tRNA ligase [Gaiellaceae bacterium]|nr:alanine--tRNA ligase [Gaiellaceae bacterium]
MRTTAELREGFLAFFEEKEHLRLASSSLVPPPDDQSTLFTVAGMQQLKPYLLGLAEPPSQRLTSAQKTFRTVDVDNVGNTARHLTFFEMLGNFSLGDYFKDGAIDLAWEFVTERLGFDPETLWATVFAGDPELRLGPDEVAIEGWRRIGMPPERIVRLPRKDNFWQAAETGPCGPNSELYLDRGAEHGCGRADCAPGCDCDRFLEFWNLVFMEFELHEDGTLTPLPAQNIDTGMGLERTAMLLQGGESVFDTDGYRLIMEWVADESGVRYGDSPEATKAHRVLADHMRGTTFLVGDGVAPSNEGRGYVLRRLIRRSVYQGRRIGLGDVHRLTRVVAEQMRGAYPELLEHAEEIERVVRAEEDRFRETLDRGTKLFEDAAAGGAISGEDAFRLHDTYGFPVELTRELAAERGLALDEDAFTRLMAEQRERSRSAAAFEGRLVADLGGPRTDFVGYERTEVLTAVTAFRDLGDGTFEAKLERSPFYPEGGGQVSDAGWIEHEETGARAELRQALRVGDDQVLVFEGKGFAEGARVRAVVPWSIRFPTMANHTATHLLHQALRETLGEHVRQAGSAVRPDKLRFDFTHGAALTDEERERIERRVNEQVFANLPVRAFETPIEEARNLGAMMLFGEKYGDVVRVVEIDGYSRELCGGTHVRSTAEVGPFAIVSEGSVGSGTRRIEAVTAGEAWALLRAKAHEAEELRAELERVKREARKQQAAPAQGPEVVEERRASAGGVEVIVIEARGAGADELLQLSDRLKQQHAPAAIVLGSREDGAAHLILNFDRSLEERGLDASKIVREAAAHIGGGGGGRPTMARAGGREPARLPDALTAAERQILAALGETDG